MLFSTLLLLLVIDCLALILVVLLQAGKGGGLAAGFGGAGTGMEMMGSRQTATFLHNAKRTIVLAAATKTSESMSACGPARLRTSAAITGAAAWASRLGVASLPISAA